MILNKIMHLPKSISQHIECLRHHITKISRLMFRLPSLFMPYHYSWGVPDFASLLRVVKYAMINFLTGQTNSNSGNFGYLVFPLRNGEYAMIIFLTRQTKFNSGNFICLFGGWVSLKHFFYLFFLFKFFNSTDKGKSLSNCWVQSSSTSSKNTELVSTKH